MISSRALVVVAACLGISCGAPTPGTDAGPEITDVEFTAVPDPAELTTCGDVIPGAGEVRAKHVTCDAELVQGALAMGRIGDIVIENAHARFIVREGTESASTIGGPAGGIVDAAPHGGTDILKELLPTFDLSSIAPSAIEVVDAGEEGEARVRVLFEDAPIGLIDTVIPGLGRSVRARGQLDYVLGADDRALSIEVTLTTSLGVTGGIARGGVLALLGGQEEVQSGYGVLSDDMLGGDGTILIGERDEGAIGLMVVAETGTLLHVDTIHVLQGARLSYQRGETTTFEARLAVAATGADVYAALAEPDLGVLTITGTAGDRVEIARDGAVLLRTALGTVGRADVPLAPGTYDLRAGFGSFFAAATESVEHAAGGTTHALAAAPAGVLRISATVDGELGVPVRVTVLRDGDELARFVAMGPTPRRLPPGAARVTVSHGLEHDVFQADVILDPTAPTELAPILDRAIDTVGWASVDLHLHSELSTDSVHPVLDALRMIAAEGLDAASSSDHDFITDYPALSTLAGIEGRLFLVPGEEVSTTVFGHVNGYPLVPDLDRAGAGAFPWFDRSPIEIFDALRERGDDAIGGALVQVNHPRLGGAGFFDAMGLDRDTGHATADPTVLGLPPSTDLDDFSFDVIEVWNGYTRGDNEASFEDYLALFAAGRRFTMVGNSDSHLPTLPAGSPRSFVRVTEDAPGAFGWEDIAISLRAGDVTVAAGVFVTAELAGPRAGGSVPVHVRAQAAPWVATDRLRIYAGRTVVLDRPLGASSGRDRVDETIDVALGGASFVVVRVDGARAPEPMQHFAPYGITNALVVP